MFAKRNTDLHSFGKNRLAVMDYLDGVYFIESVAIYMEAYLVVFCTMLDRAAEEIVKYNTEIFRIIATL